MKTLLILTILLSANWSLKAGELDGIALITPTPYERVSSSSQTLKSKVKVEIGDLINTDVAAEVKKKLSLIEKISPNIFRIQENLILSLIKWSAKEKTPLSETILTMQI